MANLTVVRGGVCSICGHKQKHHMDNKGCKHGNCDCTVIGTY